MLKEKNEELKRSIELGIFRGKILTMPSKVSIGGIEKVRPGKVLCQGIEILLNEEISFNSNMPEDLKPGDLLYFFTVPLEYVDKDHARHKESLMALSCTRSRKFLVEKGGKEKNKPCGTTMFSAYGNSKSSNKKSRSVKGTGTNDKRKSKKHYVINDYYEFAIMYSEEPMYFRPWSKVIMKFRKKTRRRRCHLASSKSSYNLLEIYDFVSYDTWEWGESKV